MAKNLVIVESPSKAKTIGRFLGDDYKVMSSKGHIRDLHKKDFSIDVEKGFAPIYEIPSDKRELVRTLKREAEQSTMVWLASDEDREGEAIAWHLYEALGLTPDNSRRIVFHEITRPAILHAIENPRQIDINLVDAQQARRVLDRIVGFELSPVLWKKIKPSLSAGRVQSVAVRLIVEREREIQRFETQSYYRVVAQFKPAGSTQIVSADLSRRLDSREEAEQCLEQLKTSLFEVGEVSVKPWRRQPAPPFTTSTLQQEASRKLGFTVSQTMRVAQMLYESGHITYMRTDSVNLSSLAIGAIKKEITTTLGEEYLKVRQYHTATKGAQEAHEAIRPTFISAHDITGTAQEKKLYNLIWKRTIASQMADAEVEKTTVNISISNRSDWFVATGEVLKFDGFLRVYIESTDDDNATQQDVHVLPPLAQGDALSMSKCVATQRFTQPPYRYNEASLVKKLEELGIGRPSTYAPTISTIQQREYVVKGESKGEERSYEVLTLSRGNITATTKSELTGAEKGKLMPTDTGTVVNDFLMQYFPTIMDYNFTAKVENTFDDIALGKEAWNKEIADFYADFHPVIESTSHMRLEHKVGERQLGTDPVSGKPVSVKIGRYGPVVQIGCADDDERPRFASLQNGQSMEDITLEQALRLFELPRTLGDYNGESVSVAVGRFGPYVKHGKTFVSIPASMSPLSVTLQQAIELIDAKQQADAAKVLQTFDEEPDMQVLNGRYGAYICYKKQNYKIPKGTDVATLTLEDCRAIVADEANAPKKKSTFARRKTAKK
ncbi:MAG: type I DNA topoisomerase [Muribaculaceae bacterium]